MPALMPVQSSDSLQQQIHRTNISEQNIEIYIKGLFQYLGANNDAFFRALSVFARFTQFSDQFKLFLRPIRR